MYPVVTLKPRKETNVIFRHPWVFSGAIEKIDETITNGALVYIKNANGSIIGTGTYSENSMIAVRIFDFNQTEINLDWIKNQITIANEKRILLGYGPKTETTGYRLIFGESDNMPGLVIDRYGNVFVLQISTPGTENLRDLIKQALIDLYNPEAIIEKSGMPTRKEENMEEAHEILYGELENQNEIEFKENGHKFISDPINGQKTGYFLDQKDLRAKIGTHSKDKKILNLFSYSGASGIYAMKGGASSVHNVDSSDLALLLCEKHAKLNKIKSKDFTTENADIFNYMPEKDTNLYDMVIMDPPALIKSNKDIQQGQKAYHFLNRGALRLVKNNGIFVTSSCSHYMNEEDFSYMLRRASVQNNTSLSILNIIRQAPDHPLSVYFPESSYLKTFICLVKK
ncbi:MAG: SAM-dependent methyltransferase [Candidatus Peregrinibacteria bacterium GW2011_GWC2_39_14]|nr:MAG: Ribosomal L11 methyltransferase [Candidatus Peregrinibacteria bacterium GW2011_GWA2_38_36]KKR05921.1 MAG: SAM-dependent methyltransferase [Candidatus Peregrinibacteria bacterium GW2011_GWC2_39_14]